MKKKTNNSNWNRYWVTATHPKHGPTGLMNVFAKSMDELCRGLRQRGYTVNSCRLLHSVSRKKGS